MAENAIETKISASLAKAPTPVEDKSQDDRDIEKGSILEADEARSTEESRTNGEKVEPGSNIVSWDGPDDSKNPMNWSSARKFGNIVVVSLITLITFVDSFPRPSRDKGG